MQPHGSMYRRNRRFIHKTNEAPQPEELNLPQYEVLKYEPLQGNTLVLKSDDIQSREYPDTGISPKSPKQSKPNVTRSRRTVKPKIIPSMLNT